MLLCDSVRTDASRRMVVEGLFHTIYLKRGQSYPAYSHLCVLTILSAVRDSGMLQATITEASTQLLVASSISVPVAQQQDPLDSVGVIFHFSPVLLPIAGAYWVDLWYDDFMIA